MTLFRNKYRVESIRKPGWDYSSPGLYFVTICTHEMRMYFGRVVNSEMKLSTVGKCAEEQWKAIPSHFRNISLDEFVVMPNHLHGIIKISGPWEPELKRNDIKRTLSDFSPRSGSLSHIIRCYKGGVTYWCKDRGFEFAWKIKSLEAVREYIRDNPKNWERDEDNPERRIDGAEHRLYEKISSGRDGAQHRLKGAAFKGFRNQWKPKSRA